MSDQQVIVLRLDGEEWQRVLEAVMYSEDGQGITDRIRDEVIQDGRLSWEMGFTVREWTYIADAISDDDHLADAWEVVEDQLLMRGWVL